MCVCLCIYIYGRGSLGKLVWIHSFCGFTEARNTGNCRWVFFHFCFTPSVGSRGGNSWPDIHITWHQTKSEDEIDMSTTKDNSLLKLVFVVPCQVAMDFIWVKTR